MTKMLHELITLAKEGKKFTVKCHIGYLFDETYFLKVNDWSIDDIVTPWADYKEKHEPIVIWVNVYPTYNECYDLKETAEYHANDSAIRKAVKFVEVVE